MRKELLLASALALGCGTSVSTEKPTQSSDSNIINLLDCSENPPAKVGNPRLPDRQSKTFRTEMRNGTTLDIIITPTGDGSVNISPSQEITLRDPDPVQIVKDEFVMLFVSFKEELNTTTLAYIVRCNELFDQNPTS